MFYTQLFIQNDAVAPGPESVSEFDVFNRWLRIPIFIKPSDLKKDFTSHGPASCPECSSLGIGALVDKVVLQILVLRDEIPLGRLIVIRAEDRSNRLV